MELDDKLSFGSLGMNFQIRKLNTVQRSTYSPVQHGSTGVEPRPAIKISMCLSHEAMIEATGIAKNETSVK